MCVEWYVYCPVPFRLSASPRFPTYLGFYWLSKGSLMLLRRRRREQSQLKWVYILPTILAFLKLNMKQSAKFEIDFKIYSSWHVLRPTQNLSFHVVVLQRTTKKCTKNIMYVHNHCIAHSKLFSDVLVGVVVFFNSLIISGCGSSNALLKYALRPEERLSELLR